MAPRGRPSRETVYQRFAAAVDELGRFGGLPTPSEARQIWDDIWHVEAHNSTALEGNTLVLRDASSSPLAASSGQLRVVKEHGRRGRRGPQVVMPLTAGRPGELSRA